MSLIFLQRAFTWLAVAGLRVELESRALSWHRGAGVSRLTTSADISSNIYVFSVFRIWIPNERGWIQGSTAIFRWLQKCVFKHNLKWNLDKHKCISVSGSGSRVDGPADPYWESGLGSRQAKIDTQKLKATGCRHTHPRQNLNIYFTENLPVTLT